MNTIKIKIANNWMVEADVIYMDATYIIQKTIDSGKQVEVLGKCNKGYGNSPYRLFKYTVVLNTANCLLEKQRYDRIVSFNNKREALRFIKYLSSLDSYRILIREKAYLSGVVLDHCKAYKPLSPGYYRVAATLYKKGQIV